MKIPERLDILGYEYQVLNEVTHNDSHYGHAKHKDAKIILYSSPDYTMPEQIEAETLLHEIIHSIDTALCLDLDENTVTRLSKGLFAVIRQNNLDFRKDTPNA